MPRDEKFSHEFDLGVGKITVSGTATIPDGPGPLHVKCNYSGAASGDFEFDVATEQCHEFTIVLVPLRICIRVDVTGRKIEGRIQTKNLGTNEWSDATWVVLARW